MPLYFRNPNQRDPRTDPRPGDVVAKQLRRGLAYRQVVGREGNRVKYYANNRAWVEGDGCHLLNWIAWAEDAQVIQRGGPGDEYQPGDALYWQG